MAKRLSALISVHLRICKSWLETIFFYIYTTWYLAIDAVTWPVMSETTESLARGQWTLFSGLLFDVV